MDGPGWRRRVKTKGDGSGAVPLRRLRFSPSSIQSGTVRIPSGQASPRSRQRRGRTAHQAALRRRGNRHFSRRTPVHRPVPYRRAYVQARTTRSVSRTSSQRRSGRRITARPGAREKRRKRDRGRPLRGSGPAALGALYIPALQNGGVATSDDDGFRSPGAAVCCRWAKRRMLWPCQPSTGPRPCVRLPPARSAARPCPEEESEVAAHPGALDDPDR